MTNAAIAVGQPPWEKNNTSGTSPSTAVLKCASIRDSRPGRRSSGKCSKNLRLMHRGRNTGLLLIIVEITNGKCLLSLDVAAPSQMTRQTSLAAMIMSTPANRNATVKDAYTSPRAARKITLSRSPSTASRPRIVQICHSGSTPTVVPSAGIGPVPSENSAIRSITSNAAYSATSNGVRAVPLVSGIRLGHGGSRMVVGPQPVQDRAHRREEPVVQRTEAAAQPDDLEQHRVEHDLFEDDRLGVPRRHIGEPVDALGGQHDQPAAEDVEQDLDDVEQVQHDGRSEADLGPVPGPSGRSSRRACPYSTPRSRRRARPASETP